ncbi:MAG TPA: sensor histidine kinase [Thermoflexia bacterium]|nr:MAG: sensor histidine kinase [Chloroflexota bacterium]HEY67081.1 sensor histidine kinase [Thermoflexia bacterium]
MAVSTKTDIASFEQFLEECSKEHEQVQRELKEIDLLIQQTTAEVERLAQRNTQVTNRLRQVEATLDTIPREDIQEAYTTVLDTQQRLFTMRGQLEKLQSDQRNLARYLDLLRNILEIADHTEYEPRVSEKGEPAQPLVVRIIEAQERERQRLSRQMHDGPAQSLTNLILQAEICERLFDTDPKRTRAELANLKNAVAATFQKIKGFIINLRPMMLDDLGLVPTLRRYVDSFTENSGVLTRLTVSGKERRLAPYKEVTIFRLVQELLNNAYEYGHASNVQINLDMGDDLIRVSVEDNGSGFELSDTLTSPDADRLGLAMMRERVEMLGGQIHFDSSLGRGTKVSFELPAS